MKKLLSHLWNASPAKTPAWERAEKELADLARQRPVLATACGVVGDLLPWFFSSEEIPSLPDLTRERVREKLAVGRPMLAEENLLEDPTRFDQRWTGVVNALERHQGKETYQPLRQAVKTGGLQPFELFRLVQQWGTPILSETAERLGLPAGLLGPVLRLTMLPRWSALAQQLKPLREGVSWQQGFCPTCGSWPLVGEFRGLEQLRYLRCGLCADDWVFPQLCCPFCGNQDHRRLGYFHAEGEDRRWRALTCEECRTYVKTASSLAPRSAVELLILDLATLHLDLIAGERGYVVP